MDKKTKVKLFSIGLILLVFFLSFCFNLSSKEFQYFCTLKEPSFTIYSGMMDSFDKIPTELPPLIFVQKTSIQSVIPPVLISPKVFGALIEGRERELEKEIISEYIVESGDNIWSLAQKFGISVETIIWANDLENSIINPGQKLVILPVSGVVHLVKEGDTLEKIAQKYHGNIEEIIAFNEIEEEIFEGQFLIIPGGKIEKEKKKNLPSHTNYSTNNFYGLSHSYPYGYCTWWVAQKRQIPSLGNAKDWLKKARSLGLSVCVGSDCQPQKNAVIVLKTRHPLGHVGYVERVEGKKVIFSEMNYIGWAKMNYRTLKIGDKRILGYIY